MAPYYMLEISLRQENNIIYSNSMNRQDLEKLSKDELINLVVNQNQNKGPRKKVKFTIPNKVKKFISKYKTVSMRGPGRRDTTYLSDLDEAWSD